MRALRGTTAGPPGRRAAQASAPALPSRTLTTTTTRLAAANVNTNRAGALSPSPAPSSQPRAPGAAALPRRAVRGRRPLQTPPRSVDYVASAADEGVLGLPPRTELTPQDLAHVFGYARDLTGRYYLGRVLGAGSFGVVREAISVDSGHRHAVKTIPKAPKRGPATPR